MKHLWHALDRTARRFPGRAAVLQGEDELTFAALRELALRYRTSLRAQGVGRGDRVLVWSDPSPGIAAALVGVWASGAIAVVVDPSTRGPAMTRILESTEPGVFVCRPEAESLASSFDLPVLETSAATGGGEPAEEGIGPEDAASILFTSGSTGEAKGVLQTHGSLVRGCGAVAESLGITSEDRILCPVPWGFDYGFGQLHLTLALGATHVLPTSPEPFSVCAAIEHHRPTLLAGIPSLYHYLLQGLSPFRGLDLSCIGKITSTGATMPEELLQELMGLLPGAGVHLNYGLTESYRTTTLDPARVRDRPDSIGRPIPGVEVLLLREDGSAAAPGEEGEIVHRGDYLFREYWGDPEATARALRPDPGADSGVALFTGDYGVQDDEGLLYFRGRRDRLIKSMGVRVHPGEVEQLLRGSKLVQEVAVFALDREMVGSELWAAVVAPGESRRTEVRLKAYCRERLSPFQQPRRYLSMEQLPRTPSGKIDYPELQLLARERIGGRRT